MPTSQKSGSTCRYEWEALEFQTLSTEVTYLMFDQLLTLVFGELRSLFSNRTWRAPEASIPVHGALLSINFGRGNGASPLKAGRRSFHRSAKL